MDFLPKSRDMWALVVLAFITLNVVVIYLVEDWRGMNAWEQCKHDLDARGAVLDWNKFIPPPVPDDQNVFKAPHMAEWFVKPKSNITTNELTASMGFDSFSREFTNASCVTLARIVVTQPPAPTESNSNPVDLEIHCEPSAKSFFLWTNAVVDATNFSAPGFIIPLIQFEVVPLSVGVENLARQAGVEWQFDTNRPPANENQEVNLRFEDLTAMQALQALANQSGLRMENDPNTNRIYIVPKDADASPLYVSPDLRVRLAALVRSRLAANLPGWQGLDLLTTRTQQVQPLQIACRSTTMPAATDLIGLLGELLADHAGANGSPPLIYTERDGTNAFRLVMNAADATDYLNWSDQFTPDFNLMRTALKRPFARMDGNYTNFATMPIQNYVSIRAVTQVLAQRTQCYLLLGQPEKALTEITLLSQLHHLLEDAPTGKPMTLVAAMINVAVTEIYVSTVADGLRMHAWRKPELAALQVQLNDVNLFPSMSEAFKTQRAGFCSYMDNGISGKAGLWSQMKSQSRTLLPYGWIYQNWATALRLYESVIDSIDVEHTLVLPEEVNSFQQRLRELGEHSTPYSYIARFVMPDFSKAVPTFAHSQTFANEAQIACALERYRLAHSKYPEHLAELVPQFIAQLPHDIIGGQPLLYHRTGDGKFLLYSVGWNQTDDGGTPGTLKNVKQGDWVLEN